MRQPAHLGIGHIRLHAERNRYEGWFQFRFSRTRFRKSLIFWGRGSYSRVRAIEFDGTPHLRQVGFSVALTSASPLLIQRSFAFIAASRGSLPALASHAQSLFAGTWCAVRTITSTITSIVASSSSIPVSRSCLTPRAAASSTLPAYTVLECRSPRPSRKLTVHSRTAISLSVYHLRLIFSFILRSVSRVFSVIITSATTMCILAP